MTDAADRSSIADPPSTASPSNTYDADDIVVLEGLTVDPKRLQPTNYLYGDDFEAASAAVAGWVDGINQSISAEARRRSGGSGQQTNAQVTNAPMTSAEVMGEHLDAIRSFVRALDYVPLDDAESRTLRVRMSEAMAIGEHAFRPNAAWQDWYVDLLLAERLPFERWYEAQALLLDRTVRRDAREGFGVWRNLLD